MDRRAFLIASAGVAAAAAIPAAMLTFEPFPPPVEQGDLLETYRRMLREKDAEAGRLAFEEFEAFIWSTP